MTRPPTKPPTDDAGPDRVDGAKRRFMKGSAAAAGSLAGGSLLGGVAHAQTTATAPTAALEGSATLELATSVNGTRIERTIDARRSLLDLLREGEGLTGTKVGCRHGQCGACTVHVDGTRVLACLTLAAQVQDREVTTIEGIGTDESLHPVQEAFVRHDALQCGYCTPGQVMSAIGCIREGHAGSDAEIAEYMSGNLCRCGAYVGIRAAVAEAAARGEG